MISYSTKSFLPSKKTIFFTISINYKNLPFYFYFFGFNFSGIILLAFFSIFYLEAHLHTQEAGRRPYGVGLLVIGQDSNGPHLFETSPKANHYEYIGQAIGARSQSARTYIEKVAGDLAEAPLDKLIRIGVTALKESLQSGSSEELNTKNCSIAVVGEDSTLKIYDGDDVQQFVNIILYFYHYFIIFIYFNLILILILIFCFVLSISYLKRL